MRRCGLVAAAAADADVRPSLGAKTTNNNYTTRSRARSRRPNQLCIIKVNAVLRSIFDDCAKLNHISIRHPIGRAYCATLIRV